MDEVNGEVSTFAVRLFLLAGFVIANHVEVAEKACTITPKLHYYPDQRLTIHRLSLRSSRQSFLTHLNSSLTFTVSRLNSIVTCVPCLLLRASDFLVSERLVAFAFFLCTVSGVERHQQTV